MENLKPWIRSSLDPAQVSNTIRGIGTALSGTILLVLALTSHPTTPGDLTTIVNQVALLGGQLAAGLGAAWTLYGLLMKAFMFFGTKKD